MPVSVHTDDNRSLRTELLSPTSGSSSSRAPQSPHSNSQSQSPTSPRDRDTRHHRNHSRTNHNHTTNGHTNGTKSSSRSLWKSRERELLHANLPARDLVHMIIEAEKETNKLHSTLSNTISLLDDESRKCAALERDTITTFSRLNSQRETAQARADNSEQDLRVAHFELEHAQREITRLKEELDIQKRAREEVESELIQTKDAAYKIKRERIMDRAREEGRREGFEAGFMKAQAETVMRMQMRVGAASAAPAQPHPPPTGTEMPPRTDVPAENDPQPPGDEEPEYEELDSIPIVTPPQGAHSLSNGQSVPMRTGYSPTRRPARRRVGTNTSAGHRPDPRDHRTPEPSVDHYPVSIPPAEVIERTQNINPHPSQGGWVTGRQYGEIHGQTPLMVNTHTRTRSSENGHAGPSSAETPTSASGNKPRVKFRRPSLKKTKQTAASWYRSLSFRKKQKPKVLIDPEEDEDDDDEGGEMSNSLAVTPTTEEAGPPTSVVPTPSVHTRASSHPPSVVKPSSRHSRAVSASASSGVRARDYGYPGAAPTSVKGHNSRAPSIDSMSTHTSHFDILTAPSMSMSGGYSKGGPANTSVGSFGSAGTGPGPNAGLGGKAQSISGKSAKSGAGGIVKKLSRIEENPMSRDSTPIRPTFGNQNQNQNPGPSSIQRPFAFAGMGLDGGDRRSMRSGKSASSRMITTNPDPVSSPEWSVVSGGPSQIYARPPMDSALLRPAMASNTSLQGGVAPLRTKKSGGSGIGLNTPTPMPRASKGKGKEREVPTMLGRDLDMVSGSGHEASPGIGIDVQTPSDGVRYHTGHQDPHNAAFLSPRGSTNTLPQHSTPRHSISMATSTTKVSGPTPSPRGFPRSISPIPKSTPKIFQVQAGPDHEGEMGGRVRNTTEVGYTNNAGMTPGPMLFHPLPSKRQAAGAEPVVGLDDMLGAELQLGRLHRAGSNSSMRSQGSYGKFDASKYEDPAIWGAPPGAFERAGSANGLRPVSRGSSRRISYADM
ncbi:hypothetical protein P691DRAFT_778900 [Macrolepiota fuliginosa MF-IS2]|uniref:Uncharacterized protein n=1 Tax=Macrolepiota fuliginosa MF-IS2 TaxID=1400762 RepID=A0A9P5X4U8_9AGAR|nr:hypothetical protein P691DRAFT_778900 [Macrolepiota fuliginosa MF-IS2]